MDIDVIDEIFLCRLILSEIVKILQVYSVETVGLK